MSRNWKTLAFVAAAAVGGLLAGRALAGDDKGGMPEPQKTIEANALVKSMVGKWNVKTSGSFGEGEAVATFRLGVGKTVLVEEYDSKGGMGEFSGAGWMKIGDDGKAATLWWVDSMSKEPNAFKGNVTDTGYELTEGEGAEKVTIKLTKKGEGFEWTMTFPGGNMTGVYTKAK